MAGNDLSVRVDAQVGNLDAIATGLRNLIENPPDDVSELFRIAGSIPLPDLPVVGDLTAKFGELQGALPGDLSGLLSGVLSALERIETDFGGAIGTQLSTALLAIERIHALTRVDLRCLPAGSGAGAPGGGAGGGASGGGAGAGGEGEAGEGEAGGGASEESGGEEAASEEAGTAVTVERANALLDEIEQPAGAQSVLRWMHRGTGVGRTNPLVPAVIPVFDDIRDPVDTLITWDAMTPAELGASLSSSLEDTALFVRSGIDSTLEPLAADVNALVAAVPMEDLERIATDLAARLNAVRAAVTAGDLTGMGTVATQIHTLLDEYDALRPTLPASLAADAVALQLRLHGLADELHDAFCHVLSVLRPGGAVLLNLPQDLEATMLVELGQWFRGVTDWLEDVLRALDLEALQTPIAELADGARSIAQALDEALAAVVVQVQALFSQVETLLDSIDSAALANEVEAAVNQFRDQVVQTITQAVAPARSAIEQAVSALDGAADAFDPEDIVSALTDAVNSVAGVLQDPEVTGALGQIQSAVDSVAQQIEALSFAPVTDQVIGVIGELTAALESIDPAELPAPAAAALSAAVTILPPDLAPVTEPIIVDFDGVIEAGPVVLVARIKQEPARLLEHVTQFEPARLIGDPLNAPFESLIRELEAFRPSELLRPLDDALAEFRQTLLRSASPSIALAPLDAPFAEVTAALGRLDPQQLTQPIEDALSETIDRLMSVLPVQDLFDTIDAVLNAVRRALNTSDGVVALLRRVHGIVEALGTAEADLQSWIDEVLDKIEQVPDAAALNTGVVALRDAVDAIRGTARLARFDSLTATSRASLDAADGTNRLSAVITAYNGISRPALEAMPDSAARTALLAALDRVNPLDPNWGAPWKALGDVRAGVVTARSNLEASATDWDERFLPAGGTLLSLRRDSATPADLRQAAQAFLDAQLVQPVAAVAGFLEPVRAFFDALLTALEDLLTRVRASADALLLGPDSVSGLRDALGEIVTQITDLNLDFLEQSLGSLFATVRGKLDAISPASLAAPLDAAFASALDTLDIDLILPEAQLDALNVTYDAIVTKLRALAPGELVIAAVQPVWDETVLPLLASFDLSPVFDAVIEKLRALDVELRAELLRVNGAYQELLAAVPAAGASVSVSAEVSL
jgi:hypothetical protein